MICIFAVTICLLLISCNNLISSDNIKNSIPGTYSSSWTTEFSESIDTLLIEPLMKQGSDTYSITRRTHVSFFKDARNRNPEYKIARWTGSYDPRSKTVVVNNNARVLSFDPVNKEMKMGTKAYRKL